MMDRVSTRPDKPDLRGHQPDPAHCDGPAAPQVAMADRWPAISRV